MSRRKDKQLRRSVRKEVGDNSRRFLLAIFASGFFERLRWSLVILFRLGYKDLILGNNDGVNKPD